MLAHVHPLACVSPHANLAAGTEVGPFAVIEAGVNIGPNCRIAAHAVIKCGTSLGADNQVGENAVLGGQPQHIAPPEETGQLKIGDGNAFREHVTLHRAMHAGQTTLIGDGNLLMVNAHVAHDCVVGNEVILANNVMLGGHVQIADRAYLGGAVGVHQHCRIGSLAMVGGQARVTRDVPPFVMVDGETSCLVGLNKVGLRRAGYSTDDVAQLKEAYRFIYRSGLAWAEMLEQLCEQHTAGVSAAFTEFFSAGQRGFTPDRRGPAQRSVLKMPQVAESAASKEDSVVRKAG